MCAKLIDKVDKQDDRKKAAEIGKKIEIHLHPLTLQVKDNSETLSPMKLSYNVRNEKISNNNKISTKFYTAN